MADHTSPDYYDQVAKEARQELKLQDEKIIKDVDEVLDSHMWSLISSLEREFGRASVSHANLKGIKNVLYSLAHSSAEKAKFVMIDAHYKETQKSLGRTIECVFAGMQLGKESA